MIAEVAYPTRPCRQIRPAHRTTPRSRVMVMRLRPGSLAWWASRLSDPQDLLGLKVILTVTVFTLGGLIGP